MTKIRDKAIASFLLCLLVPVFCFAEPSANLVGVWHHSTFVQIADGKVVRKYDSADGGTLEYRTNGTWRLNNPPHQSSGTYRWTNNGLLESTITNSDLPNQIGFTSMKKATAYEQTLVLVTEYDEEGMKGMAASPDGTRPKSMIVTSTFRRITAHK